MDISALSAFDSFTSDSGIKSLLKLKKSHLASIDEANVSSNSIPLDASIDESITNTISSANSQKNFATVVNISQDAYAAKAESSGQSIMSNNFFDATGSESKYLAANKAGAAAEQKAELAESSDIMSSMPDSVKEAAFWMGSRRMRQAKTMKDSQKSHEKLFSEMREDIAKTAERAKTGTQAQNTQAAPVDGQQLPASSTPSGDTQVTSVQAANGGAADVQTGPETPIAVTVPSSPEEAINLQAKMSPGNTPPSVDIMV